MLIGNDIDQTGGFLHGVSMQRARNIADQFGDATRHRHIHGISVHRGLDHVAGNHGIECQQGGISQISIKLMGEMRDQAITRE